MVILGPMKDRAHFGSEGWVSTPNIMQGLSVDLEMRLSSVWLKWDVKLIILNVGVNIVDKQK